MGSSDQPVPLADQRADSACATAARPLEGELHRGDGIPTVLANPNRCELRKDRGSSFLMILLRALSAWSV